MDAVRQLYDLEDELLRLCKYAGATSDRIQSEHMFLEIMGGSDLPYEIVKARLITAIRSLQNPRATEVLLAALALTEEYEHILTLQYRLDIIQDPSEYEIVYNVPMFVVAESAKFITINNDEVPHISYMEEENIFSNGELTAALQVDNLQSISKLNVG